MRLWAGLGVVLSLSCPLQPDSSGAKTLRTVTSLAARDASMTARLSSNEPSAVALPSRADAAWSLAGVQLTAKDTRGTEAERFGNTSVYRDVATGTDALLVAGSSWVEAFWLLRDESAPHVLSWRVELTGLVGTMANGSLVFTDGSGSPRVRVSSPFAFDATGRELRATLDWKAPILSVRWEGEATFPVLIDPLFELIAWEIAPVLSARTHPGLAARGANVVLFGGTYSSRVPNAFAGDTWEWDGAGWNRKQPANSPSARMAPAMTAFAGKVLLFGGIDANGPQRDTWEWDGTNWTQLTPAHQPLGAQAATMAVFGGHVILFTSSASASSTWEWDGSDWTELTTSTHPITIECAAASTGTEMMLMTHSFGLHFWRWTGSDWLELVLSMAPSSWHGSLAARGNRLVFAGGPFSPETWEWDGTNWSLSALGAAAQGRENAGMTSVGSQVFLFGGQAQQRRSDLWSWDGAHWSQRAPDQSPQGRARHSLVEIGGEALLHGGISTNSQFCLTDTWSYDGQRWTHRNDTGPGGNLFAMAALGSKAVYLGRTCALQFQTWEWDGTAWSLKAPDTAPPSRSGHAMATLRNNVILFGGIDTTHYGDTWEWNGSNWRQLFPSHSPPPRSGHAMATIGGRIVLFGGDSPGAVFGDTWEWDGTDWTELSFAPFSSPAPRSGHSLSRIGSRLVTTGESLMNLADTVEWDGSEWSRKVVPGPAPRSGFMMAGAGRGRVVGFGDALDFRGDTWLYSNVRLAGSDCGLADDCQSGFCADRVCCDSACGGGAVDCLACGVDAGAPVNGVCAIAVVNVPCRDALGDCDLPERCDGVSPSCPGDVLADPSTQCQPADCDAGVARPASFCTGASAACPTPLPLQCAPFVCAAAACGVSCAGDFDCTTGWVCEEGSCAQPLSDGATCLGDHACASNHCADGVCCDQACTGPCEACDVLGQAGACSIITGEPHGARACQGTCAGQRADRCEPLADGGADAGSAEGPREPPAMRSGCGCASGVDLVGLAALFLWRRGGRDSRARYRTTPR